MPDRIGRPHELVDRLDALAARLRTQPELTDDEIERDIAALRSRRRMFRPAGTVTAQETAGRRAWKVAA